MSERKKEIKFSFIRKIMQICIHPALPPHFGCDPRSIFKQSKAGLNSESSFS